MRLPPTRRNKMSTSSRIATWNANGLLRHVNELEAFYGIRQKLDVCIISETKFSREKPSAYERSSYTTQFTLSTLHPVDQL